jgi:hypothetical protein
MCVRMHVCMHVMKKFDEASVAEQVCMYAFVCMAEQVCMYVSMRVRVYGCDEDVCMHVCVYVCMYVCM